MNENDGKNIINQLPPNCWKMLKAIEINNEKTRRCLENTLTTKISWPFEHLVQGVGNSLKG